jgi:hypothetical protein
MYWKELPSRNGIWQKINKEATHEQCPTDTKGRLYEIWQENK